MKSKKIPIRSCVVTKEKYPKQELIRLVRSNDQQIIVDLKGKANGRGAYIKRDLKVLEKARKNKILDKVLECQVPDEIYKELEKIINESR